MDIACVLLRCTPCRLGFVVFIPLQTAIVPLSTQDGTVPCCFRKLEPIELSNILGDRFLFYQIFLR